MNDAPHIEVTEAGHLRIDVRELLESPRVRELIRRMAEILETRNDADQAHHL